MLHAKALIKDRDVFAVGSANVDNRSFRLNFEVTCFVSNEAKTKELSTWLEGLIALSREVTPDEVHNKSTAAKLLESAAHLASPLL
jgi:cardiolipin synthase